MTEGTMSPALRMLAALLLLGTAYTAQADPLLLNTGNDYAPYTDEKLPEGGMITDLVKHVFAEMKQEVKIDWLPWARGYDKAKSGVYAAAFPYIHTPERDAVFLYSDPIYVAQMKVFAKPGANIDPVRPESFRGKTLCLPLGWGVSKKMAPLLDESALYRERPKDISSCAKMVALGRVDFFITDSIQGAKALSDANLGPDQVVPVAMPLETNTLHLIASRRNPNSAQLLARFNAALKALKARGIYDQIVAAHSK
jgi:polar amino acid transport system substrate-binding protein